MQATTPFKRSWLRAKYAAAVAASSTLLAYLNTLNGSAVTASGSAGGSISSVSANGRTTTLAAASQFTLAGQDIAELCGEMLDLYDSSRAALVAAGDASPTDAEIYAQMLSDLHPAYQYSPDFSNYRRVQC